LEVVVNSAYPNRGGEVGQHDLGDAGHIAVLPLGDALNQPAGSYGLNTRHLTPLYN
jgi:hypothetical protein